MSILTKAIRQTRGGKFNVPTKLGERLMLPVKHLDELKSAPVNEVDFVATSIEVRNGANVCLCLRLMATKMFERKYTTMGSRSTLHLRVVRGQLNRNLCKFDPYCGSGVSYES